MSVTPCGKENREASYRERCPYCQLTFRFRRARLHARRLQPVVIRLIGNLLCVSH